MWYLFILLQGSGVSGSWDPYPYPSEQVCVSSAKKVQKDVESFGVSVKFSCVKKDK